MQPPDWQWIERMVAWQMQLYDRRPFRISTWGHCFRVSQYSKSFAIHLWGLSNLLNAAKEKDLTHVQECCTWNDESIEDIRRAGILHDYGNMISVPYQILSVPLDFLTHDQMADIWNHPIMSVQLARVFPINPDIFQWIGIHHCTGDGNGHPASVCHKVATLPLQAQILIICDMFDAMTTDSYKASMPVNSAFLRLRNKARMKELSAFLVEQFEIAYKANKIGIDPNAKVWQRPGV